MSTRLPVIGPHLALVVAIAFLTADAASAAVALRPLARQRPWAFQSDPIRLHGGPFRVAAPGPIPKTASTPSACGTWTELSSDQTPFVRDDHSLVYDPVRDRLLIFGGTTASQFPDQYWSNEVWALTLSGSPTLT